MSARASLVDLRRMAEAGQFEQSKRQKTSRKYVWFPLKAFRPINSSQDAGCADQSYFRTFKDLGPTKMAMKKIAFITPVGMVSGQPSFERIKSFQEFFQVNNFTVLCFEEPKGWEQKINLLRSLRANRIGNIFISMPPFRNWWIYLIPGVKIALDIRDGWSLAIRTGYGGLAKANLIKAFIARQIERYAIGHSAIVITCTPGLQNYLEVIANKRINLILNGYSKADYEIVRQLKLEEGLINNRYDMVFVCVGQFSEYGVDNARQVLKGLQKKYPKEKILIKFIGADENKNRWISGWLAANSIENIDYIFLPRMGRREMYREILISDAGLLIARDPDYDFGTKIFDYILCGKPVFNYFNSANNFTKFFSDHFGDDVAGKNIEQFSREKSILRCREDILKSLDEGIPR